MFCELHCENTGNIYMCFAITGMFGGIYGVNGRFLEIKDLTSCFKAVQCPSLAGKPKLFFLQACQGRAKQQGIYNGTDCRQMKQ